MLQDPYAAQAATALGAESAYSPDLNPYNLPQVKFYEENQAQIILLYFQDAVVDGRRK